MRVLSTLGLVVLSYSVVVRAVKWEPAGYRVRRNYELRQGDVPLHLNHILALLGLGRNGDVKKEDSVWTAQGTVLVRLREKHKNQQISDSQIDLSLRADGTIERVGGRVTKNLEESLTRQPYTERRCAVNRRRAIEIALAREGILPNQVILQKIKYAKRYWIEDKAAYNCVLIDITWAFPNIPELTRKMFVINACTREVTNVEKHEPQFYVPHNLTTVAMEDEVKKITPSPETDGQDSVDQVSKICENRVVGIGGNLKTKQTTYGIQPFCLEPIRMENGTCFFENDFVKVYNVNNAPKTDIFTVIPFQCANGFSDPRNGGYSVAMDTFFHATQTVKMFTAWYGYQPFKNIQPRALVHFGQNVDNAFWDGQTLVIGDGGSETFPYSTLDTVAHEMSHGVTEMTSGLRFWDETGAINDAFSDMAGETTEFYFRGHNDWIVGAEVVKEEGKGIRYFKRPEIDGVSISHTSKYDTEMDVHHASGIFNKAFYTVAKHLGIRKTFQAFLTANRIYWRERVMFEEAACDVIKSAYDVGLPMQIFKEAFNHVGITLSSCSDFNQFVLPLSTNETRNNLIVSMTTQPLFRLEPDPGLTFMEASIVDDSDTQLYVTSSFNRDEGSILSRGNGYITFRFNSSNILYLRIRSNDAIDKKKSMIVTFY